MDYKIKEVISYQLDESGLLVVSFTLNDDDDGTCRYIETESIKEWAEENDIDRYYWIIDHNEEEDYYDNDFNFDYWLKNNDYPETVEQFIYDRFQTNDLPSPDRCC